MAKCIFLAAVANATIDGGLIFCVGIDAAAIATSVTSDDCFWTVFLDKDSLSMDRSVVQITRLDGLST